MAMFRAVFLLAVLLLCGGAGPMMTTDKTAAIRRVAVMSAVGDKFTVRKIGMMGFGNDEKEFPIDAWGIDQFVVNKVRSVLARRFEVRPVAYNKSAFLNARNESIFPNAARDVDAIAAGVRAQAKAADIDAYIVVTPATIPFGISKQSLRGLGIVKLPPSLVEAGAYLFALYKVTVVDGHSFTVIANSPAILVSQDTVLATTSIHGPARAVDESWMPATLDAAHNIRLKSAITELLDRNLPRTIETMRLLQ
jgi:hypothetical protein